MDGAGERADDWTGMVWNPPNERVFVNQTMHEL